MLNSDVMLEQAQSRALSLFADSDRMASSHDVHFELIKALEHRLGSALTIRSLANALVGRSQNSVHHLISLEGCSEDRLMCFVADPTLALDVRTNLVVTHVAIHRAVGSHLVIEVHTRTLQ